MLRLMFNKFSQPIRRHFKLNKLRYFSTSEALSLNSDLPTDIYSSPTEVGTPQIKYTGEFYSNEKLQNMVNVYLKSMQLTESYELSKQKFSSSKSAIPILNADEIKKTLYNLLQDKEIKKSNIEEMVESTEKHYESIQSFEIEQDEKYYQELVEYLQELAKFFLRNNIYTIEHTVDTESILSQEILSKLYNAQFILESMNLKQLTEAQLSKIFPGVLMITSVYDTSESLIENYINELKTRIFNPFKPDEDKRIHLEQLETFLKFLVANNFLSNPEAYYSFLILYKEIILRSSNINDLLYIMTNNIYKFATLEPEYKGEKIALLFSEFMQSYLNSSSLLQYTVVNHELFKRFLASLMLMKEEDMSLNMIQDLRKFIVEGIMPLPSMNEFLNKSNTPELMLDLDNKIFSKNDLPLNFNIDKSHVLNITDENRKLAMIINIGMSNKQDKRDLLDGLTHNLHQNLNLLNSQPNEDLTLILKSMSKYKLRSEVGLFYSSIKEGLYQHLPRLDHRTHLDLLYSLCKSNLIHAYDSNPVYLSFLLKLKLEQIDNITIIWTLAYMALRTKEFNPFTKKALWELKNALVRNGEDSLDEETVQNALEIVAMAELFMKYDMTKEDYDEFFNFEFVSNLKKVYQNKFIDVYAQKQVQFQILLKENPMITLDKETNLYQVDKVIYINKAYVPVIFVDESDFNLNKRVLPDVYIKYYHLFDHFKIKPMLLDLDKMKNLKDFERELELYEKQDGYRRYFD